jgi:signal transduction histidine kinase
MRYQPVDKLRDYFVGHHLARAEDSFEEAKIRLVFNFMMALLVVAIAFVPLLFSYEIRLFTYVNFAVFSLLLVSLFFLRFMRSHQLPTFMFASTIMMLASVNSIFNNGLLTPDISVWYFISIAFVAYTSKPRYVVALVILMYVSLAVISFLKYNHMLVLNPNPSDTESLNVATFVMIVTLPLILRMLTGYVTSKEGAISRLKASMDEKNRILGVVAHDLRNPIGAAMSCIEMAQRQIQSGYTDRANKYFGLANDSCQRALAQIEELLTFATLREEVRKLTFETTDAEPFISSAVAAHQAPAFRKKISLQFHRSGMEHFISINKLHFSRAVDNVLSNAIKFTPEGGRVDVSIERVDDNVRIIVTDTGIGIPEHLKERLFTEFTPSARTGTNQEQSTGLGMAITQQIVRLLDGRIWFESQEGKGTTFFLELPLHKNR